MKTKEKTKKEINTEFVDKHAIVYTFSEEQYEERIKDIISEHEYNKSKETELQLFGEDFLKAHEKQYIKVRPSEDNKDGVKEVFVRTNIAEILLQISETLEKINSSLMNISYRVEEK